MYFSLEKGRLYLFFIWCARKTSLSFSKASWIGIWNSQTAEWKFCWCEKNQWCDVGDIVVGLWSFKPLKVPNYGDNEIVTKSVAFYVLVVYFVLLSKLIVLEASVCRAITHGQISQDFFSKFQRQRRLSKIMVLWSQDISRLQFASWTDFLPWAVLLTNLLREGNKFMKKYLLEITWFLKCHFLLIFCWKYSQNFSEPQVVNSRTKCIPIHSGVSPQGVSKQGNKARKSHTAISFTANTLFLSRRVADIMMGKLSPTHTKPCVWWWVEFWLELRPILRK